MDFLGQMQQVVTLVSGTLSLIGLPIVVYKVYARDKENANSKIAGIKEMDLVLENKVQLLKSTLEIEIRALGTRMDDKFSAVEKQVKHLEDNDLHTIHEKQRDQDDAIGKLTKEIAILATKLDERIPKAKN